jgi:two-component system, cell cycle sensor histidine kinase and response regulator CckA
MARERKSHILVVEDERIVAQDIKTSLENIGYAVPSVVSSGSEALLEMEKSLPDLVLMDIVLKGKLSGIETVEKMRQVYDVPVVYLTAYADATTLERAKRTEPYGYILKPFEERELQSIIEMALYKHGMEKRLRDNEQRLTIILKSIADGVIAVDRRGVVTFMNPMAEIITGWREKDAAGQNVNRIFTLVHETSKKKIPNPVLSVLRQGVSSGTPSYAMLISKSGKPIMIAQSISPIRDTRAAVIGAVLVFQDITERRQNEEILRQSEERYRALFEESRDAIFITTREGKFFAVNQCTQELLGYSRAEFSNLHIGELFINLSERDQYLEEIRKSGSVRDFEIQLQNKKGEILTCLFTSSVRRGPNKRVLGYQGIIRDITEFKKDSEERERMRNQLFQAQKMEAIGILAGGIAHDFNNLMTAVQGFTEIAMMKVNETDSIHSDLNEVLVAARRATELTRQLLLFSRKQPLSLLPLNLNRSIENLKRMLERLIGEDIEIITEFEPDPWMVRADAGNMEQVVMNLALNARDAMTKGGRLWIRTRNAAIESGDPAASEVKPGNYLLLELQDSGHGMDETTLQHIFDPFFSTKGPGKGTGLGLSVVYGIIRQHEGWIDVQSNPGQGATFRIYIPAVMETDKPAKILTPQSESLRGKDSRILVVEDEESVRELVYQALTKNGYQVHTASNAEEAVTLFHAQEGTFDLLFSDVVLPGRSGIDLVEELVSIKPDLKIVLSSGYPDQKSQWKTIQGKGYFFLQKAFTLPGLLKTVKQALENNPKPDA